jgi:hypothetical protein
MELGGRPIRQDGDDVDGLLGIEPLLEFADQPIDNCLGIGWRRAARDSRLGR